LSTVEEEDDEQHHQSSTATFELGDGSDDTNPDLISKIINAKTPTQITLKLHVTESTFSVWQTVLNNINNILYVALPEKMSHEASKQSFISLLEFAEEKLEATAVVLCMRKSRPDRAALVRTFLFLGFQPLNPNSELAPPQAAAALHHSVVATTATKVEDDENLYLICQFED
jgi:hypothetical protein